MKETGVFGEIYGSLNQMDREIQSSEKMREETEHACREWIANITHDLKTPIIRFLKELMIDIINDPAFSKRVIEFESDMPELIVEVDPSLLRRAVQNIVINALVHNPLDTKVKITVSHAHAGRLSVSIRDNGNGMSEEELSKLWSRYYRGTNTKDRPEGSGLGLAIAKQIIALHGGDILVKSSLGLGTEFMILLPIGAGSK